MKSLFITGGNGEIGRAIANLFTDKGFTVTAPTSSQLDCSSAASIRDYFDKNTLPAVDAFVHCAGINEPKPFTGVTPDTILRALTINTLSFLSIVQKIDSRLIDNESRVVAISSIYGSVSRKGRIEYSTSKHGLKGMVQTMALELGHRGILVNSVSPGFIATKLTYKNNSQETINNLIKDIPLGRLGKPDNVAELVYFLCSSANQFVTGQDMVIDGGYLAGGFQP